MQLDLIGLRALRPTCGIVYTRCGYVITRPVHVTYGTVGYYANMPNIDQPMSANPGKYERIDTTSCAALPGICCGNFKG
jgi:hypothetical protein